MWRLWGLYNLHGTFTVVFALFDIDGPEGTDKRYKV